MSILTGGVSDNSTDSRVGLKLDLVRFLTLIHGCSSSEITCLRSSPIVTNAIITKVTHKVVHEKKPQVVLSADPLDFRLKPFL